MKGTNRNGEGVEGPAVCVLRDPGSELRIRRTKKKWLGKKEREKERNNKEEIK